MTWALVGLAFGWPLMWGAVATEVSDCFDAVARAYRYVYQRPLQYLFYALVAAAIGAMGWLVVSNFAAGTIAVTSWAVDWGANSGRWSGDPAAGARQVDVLLRSAGDVGVLASAGSGLMAFWIGCVKVFAVGFLSSYFWTASTCIYLLLRRDADATELDEVALDDADEIDDDLPAIRTDPTGAPVVDDAAVSPPIDPADDRRPDAAEQPGESKPQGPDVA